MLNLFHNERIRLQQQLRFSGARGRSEFLQRPKVTHPGSAGPKYVGDELIPDLADSS